MGAEDRAEEVDVVVLGVGSGGEYAARRLPEAAAFPRPPPAEID